MNIKMLHDNVLIEIPIETKTKEGVYLPEGVASDRLASYGKAVAVGKDCKQVKEGDYCFMKSYVGNVLENDSLSKKNVYTVISEKDIMAIKQSNGIQAKN